jgi:hypothetical protein
LKGKMPFHAEIKGALLLSALSGSPFYIPEMEQGWNFIVTPGSWIIALRSLGADGAIERVPGCRQGSRKLKGDGRYDRSDDNRDDDEQLIDIQITQGSLRKSSGAGGRKAAGQRSFGSACSRFL